jgi:hypothetical protein
MNESFPHLDLCRIVRMRYPDASFKLRPTARRPPTLSPAFTTPACPAEPRAILSRFALDPSWSARYGPAAFQPLSLAKLKHSVPVAAYEGRFGGKVGPGAESGRAVRIHGSGIPQPAGGRTGKGGQGG